MEMDGWMDGWMDGGMGGRMDEPWSGLDIGLQSTVLTMVEAWVALFGWIHGVELVFVSKRGSSSTIRPSSYSGKGFPIVVVSTATTSWKLKKDTEVFALLHSLT